MKPNASQEIKTDRGQQGSPDLERIQLCADMDKAATDTASLCLATHSLEASGQATKAAVIYLASRGTVPIRGAPPLFQNNE